LNNTYHIMALEVVKRNITPNHKPRPCVRPLAKENNFMPK